MKSVLTDAHELADRMVKSEELLTQLRITDWHVFTVELAYALIDTGWKAPSLIKRENN